MDHCNATADTVGGGLEDPCLLAELFQFLLEVLASDQRYVVHRSVLRRFFAGGDLLVHHAGGVVALDVRARQHRAEEAAVGFLQFADGIGAVDTNAEWVASILPGTSRVFSAENGMGSLGNPP